ncbi:MAG: response regulator [Arcobacteraceae bacterium]|nr:response regulator [Arcobacteraceae bacterium]
MQAKIAKLKEIKILFVEDEVDLITIISDTLSKLGANFVTAHNGEEGLEALAQNDDIQLVVTDINMPVMNGIEMIRQIRESGSDIPCIIMSAHTEPEYLKSADELNVTDYILKPFDFIKFINLIGDLKI